MSEPAGVHPLAAEVAARYLRAADAALPGFVEGLYLTGSAALGDFLPGSSDVDVVTVTRARPGAPELAALRRVHQRIRSAAPRPRMDGAYVTWDDLAGDPRLITPGPGVRDGVLRERCAAALHPVTWHELAFHGVAVRGPARTEVPVWTDGAVLRSWLLENLDRYWRPWRSRRLRLLSPRGLSCLGSWAPAWAVLGVSRVHCTLATGQIVSKLDAGHYALDRFGPRWHRLVGECLRIRRGGGGPPAYRNRLRRRRGALDFVAMVVDDAAGRAGG